MILVLVYFVFEEWKKENRGKLKELKKNEKLKKLQKIRKYEKMQKKSKFIPNVLPQSHLFEITKLHMKLGTTMTNVSGQTPPLMTGPRKWLAWE